MKVAYITNAERYSGVGHRAYVLEQLVRKNDGAKLIRFMLDGSHGILNKYGRPVRWIMKWPGVLKSKSVSWVRLGRVFRSYIKSYPKKPFDLFHITNQSLSFLAGRLPGRTIVTVHDLIELVDPQDRKSEILNRYLYSGISRADHIIAVSEYTKRTIQARYNVAHENISVIYNGVDTDVFHEIDNFSQTIGYEELRRDLKLGDSYPVLLYVGSDHPRKNLPVALKVFGRLYKERPDAIFLKVGSPGFAAGRELTLRTIDQLGIREAVRFIDKVEDERLNDLYNLSDVLLYPSKIEGFGLPPLQAMAAGTPVVCSNVTSLPEVVGEAALTHEPNDVNGMLESVQRILSDKKVAEDLVNKGFERAQKFSWEIAAQQLVDVYKKVASG